MFVTLAYRLLVTVLSLWGARTVPVIAAWDFRRLARIR
jgi:hypothetical protein